MPMSRSMASGASTPWAIIPGASAGTAPRKLAVGKARRAPNALQPIMFGRFRFLSVTLGQHRAVSGGVRNCPKLHDPKLLDAARKCPNVI
eukprot:6530488-Alexandrium_andersonii.AAC.1